MIPKAQYPVPLLFQEPTSLLIRCDLHRVLATVQLHYHLSLRTTKVSNEWADGTLTAKLRTTKLTVTKTRPKRLLCISLIATQLARTLPY